MTADPSLSPHPPAIFLFGLGRLGTALAHAFQAQSWPFACWNRSSLSNSSTSSQGEFQTYIQALPVSEIRRADILLLAISDQAIPSLVQELLQLHAIRSGQMALHFSGLLSSQILSPLQAQGCAIGSLHPLQPISFELKQPQPFQRIAVGYEGDEEAQQFAKMLIPHLGGEAFSLQDVQRAQYHAAAVFASNFLVTLFHTAASLLETAGVSQDPRGLLLPLMESSLHNIRTQGLPNALTGPIARGDVSTIEAHIKALPPHLLPLYRNLALATLPIAEEQARATPHALELLQKLLESPMTHPQSHND